MQLTNTIQVRFEALKLNLNEPFNVIDHVLGYKLIEFAPIVVLLNSLLHRKPKENLSTVRNKYSHKIFHHVVNIPMLDINKLFENSPEVAMQLSASRLTHQSIIASCSSDNVLQPVEVITPAASNTVKPKLPLPLIG